LSDWNEQNNDRFTIHFIDPFSWNWNMKEERVDYHAELIKQETNENLLSVLKSTSIFIHEFYNNAGMFNIIHKSDFDKKSGRYPMIKTIYNYGLRPKIDICIPNFNDIFILTNDIVSMDINIRKMAIQDYNVIGKLSTQTIREIDFVREKNIARFVNICSKTDFPEMADIFMARYKTIRFFWTSNHIAKTFSQTIFWLMNDKFLKLNTLDYVISENDLYANNYTKLNEYDTYYNWNEPIEPLKNIL